MQFKLLALAGLASTAVAQSGMSLVQALNSTADLANLTTILGSQSALVAQLSNLTNITVLAPSNAAIAAFLNTSAAQQATANPALLQAVLSYHVLNGTYQNFSAGAQFVRTALNNPQFANVTGGQRLEVMNTTAYSGLRMNSTISTQSINFTGGVIHVINKVLTVPQNITTTATAFNLTAFNGALNASGAGAAVSGLRDVTLFVPNNAAFQAIGSALPNLTTQQLVSILSYHVVNGTVGYSTLLRNMSLPTLQGNNVTITVRNASTVFVNNARVLIPDVLIANGVIHVIDEVLNPMNATAGNGTTGSPAYSGASSATNVPFTSGQATPTSSINTGSIIASATGGRSSSSSGGAWIPGPTGAIGAALGGLALIMQL